MIGRAFKERRAIVGVEPEEVREPSVTLAAGAVAVVGEEEVIAIVQVSAVVIVAVLADVGLHEGARPLHVVARSRRIAHVDDYAQPVAHVGDLVRGLKQLERDRVRRHSLGPLGIDRQARSCRDR